jgi:folate-binding protein YgfZ
MLHDSPLRDSHARFAEEEALRGPQLDATDRPGAATGRRIAFELEYLPYARVGDEGAEVAICELVAAYGPIEPEYAAIRRAAALFDAPQRGLLRLRGRDVRDFLQRMVTQDLSSLAPGRALDAFWLNRKGRIDADLRIFMADAATEVWAEVDAGCAAAAAASLAGYLFTEDVAIEDATAAWHWIELHGPGAGRALALAGAATIPGRGEAARTTLAGIEALLVRGEELGEHGWHIAAPRDRVGELWDALVGQRDPLDPKRRVRPIGWHAYNIARVEAGSPFFGIDFGPSNLPHETGLLASRVSFRKGCYLGQEVVARMESLGKPKQMLVGLRPARDLLPVAGSQVFERNADGSMGPQIGAVTSSTLAPMLGAAPIAFAMVRTAFAAPGTTVLVNAEGKQCEAAVGPLRSWPQEAGR